MSKLIEIRKGIVSSQSKGCLLFLQLGCSALIVRGGRLTRGRDVALIHAEIDTPRHRLRVGVCFWRKKGSRRYAGFSFGLKSNHRPGNYYRDRWLNSPAG